MDTILIIGLAVILVLALAMFAYIGISGRRRSTLDRAFYQKEWQKVEQLQKQGGSGWQLAIFEADKLLDQALKAAGYPGNTMGERLKDARTVFRNNDTVWQAHKLRNRLAHESNIPLNTFVVNRALGQFKAALRDLGAL